MRVAPLGACFAAEDYSLVADEARKSAEITHAHPEGIAGAIAIAVAAAFATKLVRGSGRDDTRDFFKVLLKYTPISGVRDGIVWAENMLGQPLEDARKSLGTGSKVSAQDTVPYAVWCIVRNFYDYEASIWDAVNCRGDMDTMAAIVGGVTILSARTMPIEWANRCEPLPPWIGVSE